MHSALLIDEILQLIFEEVLDFGTSSLCCVARCCQAWKDPALDRIWRRLPSAMPLLSLLPGFTFENGEIRLYPTTQDAPSAVFQSYAIRVRHIVHRHHLPAESISMGLSRQLSNLDSARIENVAAGEGAIYMSLGPQLRSLVLQTGYTKSNWNPVTIHSMIALLKECSSLERLSVRGHSLECLQAPLSRITTLRTLTLYLSSLTEQSFMTVSTFPLLMDFSVHADTLSCDYLSSAIARTGDPFFPALERLKIRAQSALVAMILHCLPRNTLRSLHVDAAAACSSFAFEDLFNAMSPLPLHEFVLEHGLYVHEAMDMPPYPPDRFFILDRLRPLSKLPLRRFVFNSPLPLDLSDPDVKEMTTWWPLLDRLELGTRFVLENTEATWNPRNSLTSLYALARGCPHLKSLVITLDAEAAVLPGSDLVPPANPHPLGSLSINSRSGPDVSLLSVMLSTLFPSLTDLTPGFVGEHEDAWNAIQDTIPNMAHG